MYCTSLAYYKKYLRLFFCSDYLLRKGCFSFLLKYTLYRYIVFFLLGFFCCHVTVASWICVVIVVIVYLLDKYIRDLAKGRAFLLCVGTISVFFVGMFYAEAAATFNLKRLPPLPNAWFAKPVSVVAEVTDIPQFKSNRVVVVMDVHRLQSKAVSLKFRLTWYGRYPRMQVGDLWQLRVRLKRLSAIPQYQGFNYARWLWVHHINGVATVVSSRKKHHRLSSWKKHRWPNGVNHALVMNRRLGQRVADHPLNYFRQRVLQHIYNLIHPPAIAAFIGALCTGSRAWVSEDQWQVFADTGTNHLVAIAGLHLGVLMALCYLLLRHMPFPHRLYLSIPIRFFSLACALLVASVYSVLAGFSLPTERALMMCGVYVVASLSRLHVGFSQRWLMALFLLVLWQPRSIFEASFWLSFIAVAVIVYRLAQLPYAREANGGEGRGVNKHVNHQKNNSYSLIMKSMMKKAIKSIWETIRYDVCYLYQVQLALFIILLPLGLYFFHSISLWMIPANLLAVPCVAWLLLPFVWLGCVSWFISSGLSKLFFHICELILTPLWLLLSAFSHSHLWIYHGLSISLFSVCFALCGGVLMLQKKFTWYVRCFGFILWAGMIFTCWK